MHEKKDLEKKKPHPELKDLTENLLEMNKSLTNAYSHGSFMNKNQSGKFRDMYEDCQAQIKLIERMKEEKSNLKPQLDCLHSHYLIALGNSCLLVWKQNPIFYLDKALQCFTDAIFINPKFEVIDYSYITKNSFTGSMPLSVWFFNGFKNWHNAEAIFIPEKWMHITARPITGEIIVKPNYTNKHYELIDSYDDLYLIKMSHCESSAQKYARIWLQRSIVNILKNLRKEALADLERAIDLTPKDKMLWCIKAHILRTFANSSLLERTDAFRMFTDVDMLRDDNKYRAAVLHLLMEAPRSDLIRTDKSDSLDDDYNPNSTSKRSLTAREAGRIIELKSVIMLYLTLEKLIQESPSLAGSPLVQGSLDIIIHYLLPTELVKGSSDNNELECYALRDNKLCTFFNKLNKENARDILDIEEPSSPACIIS